MPPLFNPWEKQWPKCQSNQNPNSSAPGEGVGQVKSVLYRNIPNRGPNKNAGLTGPWPRNFFGFHAAVSEDLQVVI